MNDKLNPLLLDFPEEIETDRLLIRMPRLGDGPALNAAVNASLDHLRPWMPWATHIPSVDELETLVRQGMARWLARQDLWLMIVRKQDGKWLGGSGLHRLNWDVPRVEIGYWIRPDEEGHGYVSEAVQAIAAFAFEQLGAERVEIRCDARNRRSAAVAQRCGFRLEGRLRHHARDTAGQVNDDLIFSRLRDRSAHARRRSPPGPGAARDVGGPDHAAAAAGHPHPARVGAAGAARAEGRGRPGHLRGRGRVRRKIYAPGCPSRGKRRPWKAMKPSPGARPWPSCAARR